MTATTSFLGTGDRATSTASAGRAAGHGRAAGTAAGVVTGEGATPAATTCEWATCTTRAYRRVDGWHFCVVHIAEHLAEFHALPEAADLPDPADRTGPPTDQDRARAWQILADSAGGWTPEELVARSNAAVEARQHVMWRIRRETRLSLPEIGRMFGRDHSTVHHACRREDTRQGVSAVKTHRQVLQDLLDADLPREELLDALLKVTKPRKKAA